jgi:integrase
LDGLGLGGAIPLPVAGVVGTPFSSAVATDRAILRIDRELLISVLATAPLLTGLIGTHGLLGMKSGRVELLLAETAALIHPFKVTRFGDEIPAGQSHFQRTYTKRSPLGYGRPRRAVALGLRLRQPRRVIVPLSAEEVAKFWRSFRTFRDLALVGLMLLDGLRSCEVLALQLEDLQLAEAQMRVLGKGNKKRVLPLPPEIIEVLEKYLRLERPLTTSRSLFVSLKGGQRGRAMTPAGLRSLFRHHRMRSQVPHANAHRFRHTFGADMVRAGISLPALQHLMGHSQIHTTMLYVQLAPQDVWREYARAVEKRLRLGSSQIL